MAIIALRNIASDHPVVPKKTVPKVNLKGMNLTTGYGSGGWTEPLARTGVTATYNPTGTTYVNVPKTGVPFSPGSTPPMTPPSLDRNPNAAQLGQPTNYTPSLQEIESNDIYRSALDAFNTQRQTDRRALASAIAGMAVRSGYDLSGGLGAAGLGDYAGDIDPTTAATAAQNPLSDRAQIQQALDRGSRDLLYAQNARGTAGSGAYTSGSTNLLEQSQLAANNAQNSALDSIRQAVNSYLQGGVSGDQGLRDARLQVAQLLSQQAGAAYGQGNDVGTYEAGYQDVPGSKGVPSSAPGVPNAGIQWGGRSYTTVADLTRELNRTGVSYARWKQNHPAAAYKLEGGI